jgi:predicted esterase
MRRVYAGRVGASRTFIAGALCTMGAVLGCGSCREAPRAEPPAAVPSAAAAPMEAGERSEPAEDAHDGGLPPLAGAGTAVSLPVPGFGDAVVWLPGDARGRARKPVMLAIHGNYDSPDFQCGMWRSMVRDRGFILCPRGIPRRDSPGPDDIRFSYEGKFAAELDAAIAALQERYGAWVDPGPMIYIGFSLGAILARSYVTRARAPSQFDRLILIEGGAAGWDARASSKAGVKRMLWGCGQSPCVDAGRAAAASFERASVPSKVVFAKGAGHTYGGAVAEAIRAEWEWLVADDPRWSR